jgi:UTP-glucose-1-phosphate uridylyltransferase
MYQDRAAWPCAFFVGKNIDAAKDIHKEMLPIWDPWIRFCDGESEIYFLIKEIIFIEKVSQKVFNWRLLYFI